MADFDAVEYFSEHRDRYVISLVAAAGATLLFLRRAGKAKGFFRKSWNLLLAIVQVGAVVGLLRVRPHGQSLLSGD